MIAVNGVGLRRVLTAYVPYHMRSRTHLGLGKDTPGFAARHTASTGRIVAIPEVGGLHHGYEPRRGVTAISADHPLKTSAARHRSKSARVTSLNHLGSAFPSER